MNINMKQQQLINELFDKVHAEYPEITFKSLEVSPDDPDHIWVIVSADMDEDREIIMTEYAANLEIDILMNFGYAISIMPENPRAIQVVN